MTNEMNKVEEIKVEAQASETENAQVEGQVINEVEAQVVEETKVKKDTKKKTTKKAEKKTTENKAQKANSEIKNDILDIEGVMKLLASAKIKVYNPNAKGKYRIFGTQKGSSLNLQKTGYTIYSTDTDFEAVKSAKVEGVEVAEGANSQDKSRPNTVRVSCTKALKEVLKIYANNPVNAIA